MNNKTLVLNPAYILRQDGDRMIITSELEDKWDVDQWFSFVHPVYGIILSFFDGTRSTAEAIKDAAEYLGVSEDLIKSFTDRAIDNPEPIAFHNRLGQTSTFPKKLLVEMSDGISRRQNYSPDDFRLVEKIDQNRCRLTYPISANLQLTMSCYVNCEYCYAKRTLRGRNVFTGDFVCALIKQLKSDGIIQIDINGGDVLLHPDIDRILQTLSDEGFSPLISTKNPIKSNTIDLIKSCPNLRLQISLDAADDKILESLIAARPGYIRQMGETLRELSDKNIPIEVNSVITRKNGNRETVKQLLDFLNPYTCVTKVKINPTGFSIYKQNFEETALSLAEVKDLQDYIKEISKSYLFKVTFSGYETVDNFQPNCSSDKFKRRAYCTGNTRNVVILPNGDVTVCEELYDHPAFVIGNVAEQSLKEIWNGERALRLFEKAYYLSGAKESKCLKCVEWDICRKEKGVCWKSILIAYGDANWNYPDPRCPKAPAPLNTCYYK